MVVLILLPALLGTVGDVVAFAGVLELGEVVASLALLVVLSFKEPLPVLLLQFHHEEVPLAHVQLLHPGIAGQLLAEALDAQAHV